MIEEYDVIPVESDVWEFSFIPYEGENKVEICIWEDGDIWLRFGDETNKLIDVDDLFEITRRAKLFKQQRQNHLARMVSDDTN